MKKIEIVVEKRFFDDLVELMNANNIKNYSLLEILKSHGEEHGNSFDYGFLSVNKNFYFICICDTKQFTVFKKNVVPGLKELGCFIMVSDVELL